MATFYIQLEDRLQKISGSLTVESITRALGYTPSNFSGSFNDLSDNPFIDNGEGAFTITDENGNIIGRVDETGFVSVDFIAGEHKLTEKANVLYVNEKFDSIEIPDIDFNSLENNPFAEDESGILTVADENGNIGFQLNSDGIYVKDVMGDGHILSNKVDKVDGKGLSTEDFTTALKEKLQSLSNYDDTSITDAVNSLRGDFDTLVSGDTSTAIKTFNEIIAFLEGVEDTESLSGIIASIEQQIAAIKIPSTSHLATKEELNNLDFYSIKNNPVTNTEDGKLLFVDENGYIGLQLESDALYVKDVIADGHTLSNKADKSELNGLATEQYVNEKFDSIEIPEVDFTGYATESWVENKKYITKEEVPVPTFNSLQGNPMVEDESGEFNITDNNGNIGMKLSNDALYVKDVVAGDHVLSNKQDILVDGEDIKTINGVSILGSGNVTVGNVYARETSDSLDDVNLDLGQFATKTELQEKQDKLVSGTNIKTVNGTSILGSGNIEISGGSGTNQFYITDFTVADIMLLGDGEITELAVDGTVLESALRADKIILIPYGDKNDGYYGYCVPNIFEEDLIYITFNNAINDCNYSIETSCAQNDAIYDTEVNVRCGDVSVSTEANVKAVDIDENLDDVEDIAIEAISLYDIDLMWDRYFNNGSYGSASAIAEDEIINSTGIGDYDE